MNKKADSIVSSIVKLRNVVYARGTEQNVKKLKILKSRNEHSTARKIVYAVGACARCLQLAQPRRGRSGDRCRYSVAAG